jgi:hypothetical protein
MFNTWNKMSENINYRTICQRFISSFKYKFHDELESSIYSVAALLNTSKLRFWYDKKFSEENVDIATRELINVAFTFIKTNINEKVKTKKLNTKEEAHSDSDQEDDDLIFKFFKDDTHKDKNQTIPNLSSIQILRNEKENFFNLLSREEETNKTSKAFWNDNKKKLPNLFKVAQFVLTVPASSAFVEGFFSLWGVCEKLDYMSDELIAKRSFLKCNLKILNELSN